MYCYRFRSYIKDGRRRSEQAALRVVGSFLVLLSLAAPLIAQSPSSSANSPTAVLENIPTPKDAFGFSIGDDYQLVNYTQMIDFWEKLAAASDRIKLVDIGKTSKGRTQWMAIISSPENLARLDEYRGMVQKLAQARISEDEARRLSQQAKAIVWIDGGLHATEVAGAQQLIKMVYEMVSRTDAETMRFLDDVIQLYVPANPDGMELVSNWYMREPEPTKRSTSRLPELYLKYAGHDNNRDFYMGNLPETRNMNQVLYREYFPQIVYNHHQTGPRGAVVFIPPFRDPFNYNFDPLIPLGVQAVGTAMQERLASEGKGGAVSRSGARYSTWWNGGLRTTAYFHNMIGILTEIIGNPTPQEIPVVPEKLLANGDNPLPIGPHQTWHFSQTMEYEISQNRAVLDYASRQRDELLWNLYRMGRNAIEKGSEDFWTVTPDRIEALKAVAKAKPSVGGEGGETGTTSQPQTTPQVTMEDYTKVLRDPDARDPRAYRIRESKNDKAVLARFLRVLEEQGIEIYATTERSADEGKVYVIRTDQSSRPMILDYFEPQDHPNDFAYPGGPPVPPYDNAGWTLAMQMGIDYERLMTPPEMPADTLLTATPPPPAQGTLCASPNSLNFRRVLNRASKGGGIRLKEGSAGEVYARAMAAQSVEEATNLMEEASRLMRDSTQFCYEPDATAEDSSLRFPTTLRIAVVDRYGGSSQSGWTQFVLDTFEFPYEIVYPPDLDAGNLRDRFDVILLPSGAFGGNRRGNRAGFNVDNSEEIPAEYQSRLGNITQEKTLPKLQEFVDAGGRLVLMGSSTELAPMLGIPVTDHLVENTSDGEAKSLPREKFYVPGSLLRAEVDTSNPLAKGMDEEAIFFFDASPAFDTNSDEVEVIARYPKDALVSGWAWGEDYLTGGIAVASAKVGDGSVLLFGPDPTFRGQPWGIFPLLFNALYGPAKPAGSE